MKHHYKIIVRRLINYELIGYWFGYKKDGSVLLTKDFDKAFLCSIKNWAIKQATALKKQNPIFEFTVIEYKIFDPNKKV
jgi:hypothetical protein